MKNNYIFRKIATLTEIVSIVVLLSLGVSWWATTLLVCCVSFASYLDGLTREKKI